MTPITFVTWLWPAPPGYRSQFAAEHVNVLFRMIDRHYQAPHRKIVVTNTPAGIESSIEVVKDTEDFAALANPSGRHNPSCYRRLRLFKPDAGATFGDRIVSLDLDTVITADIRPLVDRPEPFVIWGQADTKSRGWVNGSLWMLTAGARPQVWEQFSPRLSPLKARRAGSMGSDQGWMGYCLGRGEATWGTADGVYSYRVHLAETETLPANAKIVCFHGRVDPWSWQAQRLDWVKEHWR